MTKLLFVFLTIFSGHTAFAVPALQLDREESTLEFTAVGKPGFLRINGTGAHVTGAVGRAGAAPAASAPAVGLEGTFETRLDDLVTGIDMRDEHMKKTYLETAKFPTATLKWSAMGPLVKGEMPFTGTLTLHGVEKPVSGKADLTPDADGKAIQVEAQFAIKLSDFGIQIPKYLGITVAEDVDVRTKIVAKGDLAALAH